MLRLDLHAEPDGGIEEHGVSLCPASDTGAGGFVGRARVAWTGQTIGVTMTKKMSKLARLRDYLLGTRRTPEESAAAMESLDHQRDLSPSYNDERQKFLPGGPPAPNHR
ncbi:hypothetical protein CH252_21415 [Rhodococcus sp. 06-1477-1B]|nr:hypothetical protein CH252_21415 [Rhodococcus sp. 06-1477-1B]